MPDWRVGEFEGKFKDEFARTNNDEREDGALNISSKKLKHEDSSEKILQGIIAGANVSDSQKCNSKHNHSAGVTAFQGFNSTDELVRDCKAKSSAFPLSTESETRCQTENWNSSQFALSNGSAVLNNQSVPQSELNYGDNDINFIDWPSIDNFEDVDTFFRCDSTYGEQLENTDELSWIPSSDGIYSSDVALQAGFGSSYADYSFLDDLSEFHCAQDNSLPTADPSADVCDKQFSDNYPFNEQKNMNVYGEQGYHGDAMELLSTEQICNGHGNLDMIGEQYSSENAIQELEDKKFSVASGSQLSSSQNLLRQKYHSDSTSPSNITSESHPEKNCQFSPSGAWNMKVEKQVANLQAGQPIYDNAVAVYPGHQTLKRAASYPCENHGVEKKGLGKRCTGDRQVTMGTSVVLDGSFVSSVSSDNPCENHGIEKKGLGKRCTGDRQVTMGTSVVLDGSFVSSVSSDNSLEESSFRQLQDAVSQLDVKTKLCIRDGLYRLARSAQNRPVISDMMNNNGDSQDVQNAESSSKFVDPRSIETQTNPIDRSIALLLFHQPSGQVTGAVDDPHH